MSVVEIISGAGAVLVVIGCAFAVVGGIGLIRFPEFFARMHAGGVTDTAGAGFILCGLILRTAPMFAHLDLHGSPMHVVEALVHAAMPGIKLAMVLFFLLITSPTSGHALAKAASNYGMTPENAANPGEHLESAPPQTAAARDREAQT